MGMALDAYGNVFVATGNGAGNNNPGAVYVLTPSTGAVTPIGSWGSDPYYVALNSAGVLYATDKSLSNNGLVMIVPAGTPPFSPSNYVNGTQTTLASATAGIRWGVAVDQASNVYFGAISGQSSGIFKLSAPVSAASTATLLVSLSSVAAPQYYINSLPVYGNSLAIDGASNFYLSSFATTYLIAAPAYNTIVPLSEPVFSSTWDVKLDPAGNVYFANANGGNIGQIRVGTGLTTTYGNGLLPNPQGVALNCTGVM